MKRKININKELRSIIVLACGLVFIAIIVFLIPVFSSNKLANAFDAEGISYEMINCKNSHFPYEKSIDENGNEHITYLPPCEAAERELRESYDLDNVDFTLTNSGTFNLIDINNEAADESEVILGQFYYFQKGSDEVYSAIVDYLNQENTVFKCIAIRKGKYVFIILGENIPSSMENVLNRLSGTREQTIDE